MIGVDWECCRSTEDQFSIELPLAVEGADRRLVFRREALEDRVKAGGTHVVERGFQHSNQIRAILFNDRKYCREGFRDDKILVGPYHNGTARHEMSLQPAKKFAGIDVVCECA